MARQGQWLALVEAASPAVGALERMRLFGGAGGVHGLCSRRDVRGRPSVCRQPRRPYGHYWRSSRPRAAPQVGRVRGGGERLAEQRPWRKWVAVSRGRFGPASSQMAPPLSCLPTALPHRRTCQLLSPEHVLYPAGLFEAVGVTRIVFCEDLQYMPHSPFCPPPFCFAAVFARPLTPPFFICCRFRTSVESRPTTSPPPHPGARSPVQLQRPAPARRSGLGQR
mmetsp:Transcript_27726/g.88274  ORF Transcript_27726/g.88274 Transcript_27726/m.88274 type:complete len:223 (-) Transcript_27726:1220-1888(-)